MWQGALGVLIGYLFAVWWVRREARREVDSIRGRLTARVESRDGEIAALRDSFEKSQRAVAAYQRRARYLESAVTAGAERAVAVRPSGHAP